MLLKSWGLYFHIRCIWKPSSECSCRDDMQTIWAMVLGCPLDLFFFPLVPKNQSKGIYKNCWVHLDMLSNWICNFILTTVWEQYSLTWKSEKLAKPKEITHKMIDDTHQANKAFAVEQVSTCKQLWALLPIALLWHWPMNPVIHAEISHSPWVSFPSPKSPSSCLDHLICLRKRSMTYF